MNHIFQEHLSTFILVFFDDILVYNKNLEEHVQHLKITFDLLIQHQLLAKHSKYVFAAEKVEYLGHCISSQGVSTDPRKIEVVQNWAEPTTLRSWEGFWYGRVLHEIYISIWNDY